MHGIHIYQFAFELLTLRFPNSGCGCGLGFEQNIDRSTDLVTKTADKDRRIWIPLFIPLRHRLDSNRACANVDMFCNLVETKVHSGKLKLDVELQSPMFWRSCFIR